MGFGGSRYLLFPLFGDSGIVYELLRKMLEPDEALQYVLLKIMRLQEAIKAG